MGTESILEVIVKIPREVDVAIAGKEVTVKGSLGVIRRDFWHAPVQITRLDEEVKIWSGSKRKKDQACVGTISAHIRNMMKGVREGFTYRLKIVNIHFPITLKTEGRKILISNFLGEKTPRVTEIVGDTKVTVVGDDVILTGSDVEAVGQTAANIEQRSRTRRKDLRKFIDGIYVYDKE